MKKFFAGIVLALMVIALPVGLIGCKKSNTVTGTYKFEGVSVTWTALANEEITEGEKNTLINNLKSQFDLTLEVKKDNTYVGTGAEGNVVDKGTWKKGEGENEYIMISEDSEIGEQKLIIKDGTILWDVSFFAPEYYETAILTYKK